MGSFCKEFLCFNTMPGYYALSSYALITCALLTRVHLRVHFRGGRGFARDKDTYYVYINTTNNHNHTHNDDHSNDHTIDANNDDNNNNNTTDT